MGTWGKNSNLDVHRNIPDMVKRKKGLTDKVVRESLEAAFHEKGSDGMQQWFSSMLYGRVAERVAMATLVSKVLLTQQSHEVNHKIDANSLSWLANRSIGKTDTQTVGYDPENTINQELMPTEDALDVESRPIEDDHGITRANDAENSDPHAPC